MLLEGNRIRRWSVSVYVGKGSFAPCVEPNLLYL